jgi:hypothetical protein
VASAAQRLLRLQRACGNQAVQRLLAVIQRSHTDNVEEFITWMQAQKAFADWMASTYPGDCDPAAKDLATALHNAGIAFRVRHISFLAPKNMHRNNLNHFVVITTSVASMSSSTRPPPGQFEGGAAQVVRMGDWEARCSGLQLRIQTSLDPRDMEFQQWKSKCHEGASVEATVLSGWRTMRYDDLPGTPTNDKACSVIR